jgi:hypothetical protein
MVFCSLVVSGCETLHEVATASLDLCKVDNKGVSYVDDKDQPDFAWNISWLISEAFGSGPGGIPISNYSIIEV